MQIFIAEHSGFCEGVSKAYNTAKKYKNIYMLGNLVHNIQVVNRLANQGIKVVKKISRIPQGKTVLISAHGVPPSVYIQARKKKLKIIDTTCSWVKRAQRLAKHLVEEGYQLIIIGDKNHPEVKGLLGWSNNKGTVVSKADEIAKIKLKKRIGVIAQTTQSEENFNSIVAALQFPNSHLLVHKTICDATQKRQKAAISLAGKVDLMLIIGDEKSANTKRLTELCKKTGTPTVQIQTKKELISASAHLRLSKGKEKVGITAGASTPNWVIDEILSMLKKREIFQKPAR